MIKRGGISGQAATEYIALVGVVLIVIIPILYYVNEQVVSNSRINQANDAVSILASAADSVYALGPGSVNYVWVTIPSGVKSFSIAGANQNVIVLKLSIFGGVNDFTAQSKVKFEAKGNILDMLSKQGTYKVFLKADEDKVEFGSAKDLS